MPSVVSAALRRLVAERAGRACEYCLIHEDDAFFGCQVDHVISLKHGGATEPGNLAFACAFCNRNKGSDVGSILGPAPEFHRFYNPRIDRWEDHFHLDGYRIRPHTAIGHRTS